MKLVNKINLRFLTLLLLVFSLSGIAFYFVLGIIVDKNIDETLSSRAEKVRQTLLIQPDTGLIVLAPDQGVQVDPVDLQQPIREFSDTMVFNQKDNEYLECRKLNLITEADGRYYRIQITISRLETEDMVQLIFYFMLTLFALIVILLFLLNHWSSSSAWNPFFNTLEQLRHFKPGQKREIKFPDTTVNEFNQMNGVLADLIRKTETDFKNLKEFTENASHEMQTPVAVIQAKLETVLQDNLLAGKQRDRLMDAYRTASRLSKLNEALLLLSKIENRQFADESEINLCDITRVSIASVEEMLSMKRLTITLNIETPLVVSLNPYLADLLINNLLNNAIKHNFEKGKIHIRSTHDQIIFANTGKPLSIASDKIFHRFVKDPALNESTGLGLAIANEICKNHALTLEYSYSDAMHYFTLSHKP